jgi:hypothetical protein
MDRDLESGEPTGLLYHMDDWLSRRIPPLAPAELARGARQASQALCAWGVTALHDVSAGNDASRWALVRTCRRRGPGPSGPMAWAGRVEAFRKEPLPLTPGPASPSRGQADPPRDNGRLFPPGGTPQKSRLCTGPGCRHHARHRARNHRGGLRRRGYARAQGPPRVPAPGTGSSPAPAAPRPWTAHRLPGDAVVTLPPFSLSRDATQDVAPEEQRHLTPSHPAPGGVLVARQRDAPVCPPNPWWGSRQRSPGDAQGSSSCLPRLRSWRPGALYAQAARSWRPALTAHRRADGRPGLLSADPRRWAPRRSATGRR